MLSCLYSVSSLVDLLISMCRFDSSIFPDSKMQIVSVSLLLSTLFLQLKCASPPVICVPSAVGVRSVTTGNVEILNSGFYKSIITLLD